MLGQSPLAAVKGAPLPLFMESWVNLKAAINIPLSACAIAQSVGIQLGNERSPEPVSRVLISISCQSSNSAWLKNKQFHQQTLNLKHSGGDDAKTAVFEPVDHGEPDWEPKPPGSLSSFVVDFLSLLPWGNMFLHIVTLFSPTMGVSQNFFFFPQSLGFELTSRDCSRVP